jgi:hypothetical protein
LPLRVGHRGCWANYSPNCWSMMPFTLVSTSFLGGHDPTKGVVHRVGRTLEKFTQLFTHPISKEKARQRNSLSDLHLQVGTVRFELTTP